MAKSIEIILRHWKRKLFFCFILTMSVFILMGAKSISNGIKNRSEKINNAEMRMRVWSREMVRDMDDKNDKWKKVADKHPSFMIKSGSVSLRAANE